MQTTIVAPPPPPPVELDVALPDVLLLQVLSFLSRSSLTRCRAVSSRWQQLATDDTLWQAVCEVRYGLTARWDASGVECPSFFAAAKAWSAFVARHLGLHDDANMPSLAGLQKRSVDAWRSIEGWTAVHLPLVHESIGPAATADEWTRFVQNLGLEDENVSASTPLLSLRLLCGVRDGQRIAEEAKRAASLIRSNSASEDADFHDLIDRLERVSVRSGWFEAHSRGQQCLDDLGLLGGFSAYNHHVCMQLLPLDLIAAFTHFLREQTALSRTHLVIAASSSLERLLLLDVHTGDLSFGLVSGAPPPGRPMSRLGRFGLLRVVPTSAPRGHDLLLYLEELARRLHAAFYLPTPLEPLDPHSVGLNLFPQAGPKFTIAVTRGIRVTASAVYAPEMGSFVYSIRIKLLESGDEGYQTPAQRGFTTAQLHTRRWTLRKAVGPPDEVEGPGVVGRFPLLHEGGWREDAQSRTGRVSRGELKDGLFIYQSLSGRSRDSESPTLSFEGEIMFVPGSLEQPEGDEFGVTVSRFPLVCDAEDFVL